MAHLPLLDDVRRICRGVRSKEGFVLVFCLGVSGETARNESRLLSGVIGEPRSSQMLEIIQGPFLSGDHLNTELQQRAVVRVVQILHTRFRETLRHKIRQCYNPLDEAELRETSEPTDSDDVEESIKDIKSGWCKHIVWSHFPSVHTRNRSHRLSREDAARMVTALQTGTIATRLRSYMLQTISLRGNRLGDHFFVNQFAPALRFCGSLKKILLGQNKIQEAGAKSLAKSIADHVPGLGLLHQRQQNR